LIRNVSLYLRRGHADVTAPSFIRNSPFWNVRLPL
jgi:hypothetical protein